MGSHFRTPGDEQPASGAQTPQPAAATPPATHFQQNQQVDGVNPLAGAPVANPAVPVVPNPAAPSSTANVFMPQPTAQTPAQAPADPFDPATVRTRDGSAAPSTDVNEQRQVADLDAALASPDFTTVFAPQDLDRDADQRRAAQQAGVEPVILCEHLTKIYPAQPNKPALDDINIAIYPGEFVFLVGHSGSG